MKLEWESGVGAGEMESGSESGRVGVVCVKWERGSGRVGWVRERGSGRVGWVVCEVGERSGRVGWVVCGVGEREWESGVCGV